MQLLRLRELSDAIKAIREEGYSKGRLLEIGAGAGWQAKALAQHGYDVAAIDVPDSEYTAGRIYPVREYDGQNIPFPNGAFDIVFSSNVLEHIAAVEDFQYEILRVLQPDGIAVHLLPTSSWRLWETVMHYPFVAKYATAQITRDRAPSFSATRSGRTGRGSSTQTATSAKRLVRSALFTRRHGEVGNLLTEHYFFSRYRWNATFERTGWRIVRRTGNGLAYSGAGIFGGRLSLNARAKLSTFLGSSCHLYVLRKATTNQSSCPK